MAWDDTKIENGGETAEGRTSATEWNNMVTDQKERLKNINEDETPTLGGQLDADSNNIINLSNIEIESSTPYILLTESDVSAPAGMYRIIIDGDIMKLQGRNSDDNDYESILDLYRVADSTASDFKVSLNIPSGETYQIDGSSVVDQDVTSGSSPTLDNANMTGDISVWTNDSNYISDITGESILTLSDVNVSDLSSGEVLVYDGSEWVNSAVATDTELQDHIESDGSSHTYIDQDVTSGSSPTFNNSNMTGDVSVWTNDAEYLEDADVTSPSDGDFLKYNGTSGKWENTSESASSDDDAIHDNVDGEIDAITEKTSPQVSDIMLIEDSDEDFAKKKIQIANLPAPSAGSWSEPIYNHGKVTGEPTIDWNDGDAIKIRLGVSEVEPTWVAPEQSGLLLLQVQQDSVGDRELIWSSSFEWTEGTPPTLTTTPEAYDVFLFYYDTETETYFHLGGNGLGGGGGGASTDGERIIVADDGTGNYNTDGSNDQVEIQDAIDEASNAGGGTVYIKAGNYNIESPVEPKSNVNIFMDPAAVIERNGNLKMFETSSTVSNIEFRGGILCDDTEINEIFNIRSNDNDNIVFRDIHFRRNGGRCIYIGGNFRVFNCYGENVAQGIGTTDISSGGYPVPTAIIHGCVFENKDFTGSQNEFIDINWHNDAYAIISDCKGIGYLDNTFEMNCRWFTITNCIAYIPGNATNPYAFTAALKENSGSQLLTGTLTNCHVYNLPSGGTGFFLDRGNGLVATSCTVTADSAGNGRGYDVGGSDDATKVLLNGCVGIDLDVGVYNSIGNKCTAIAFQDINCNTRFDGTTNTID